MTKHDRRSGWLGVGVDDSALVVLGQALSHPLRVAILRLFAKAPGSASSVARELGVTSNGVAYHMRILEDLGMIEFAETEKIRGGTATVYRLSNAGRGQLERHQVL